MKKNLLVALMCILALVMLSACGNTEATTDPTQYATPEAIADPVPLTQYSAYEGFVCTSYLKTEEGIMISCSDNYVMGHEVRGQFWFMLSDKERESGESLEDNYDWKVELTSNANIVKVDFYNYKDELIGSEECKNNIAIVDQDYNGVYCDSFTLYIEEGNNLYTAHFWRSGE